MERRSPVHLGILLAVVAACASRSPEPACDPAPPDTGRRALLEMFARGYFPGRSGQVFVVPEKNTFFLSRPDDFYRFMHGSPWDYDVDVPLLFHGEPFIREGAYSDAARLQDVAPTLARLLGLPVPATMSGRALASALTDVRSRPRAVVLVVLDGMRAGYFERREEWLPNLTRLRREGAWFGEAAIDYLPTVTSAGHATTATGAEPRFHGISANAFFDRRTGEPTGPFPDLDPGTLMVPTLADHWNLATAGRAVIVVQGTTPRATVSLAGHGGCAVSGRAFVVAMFDDRSAGWVTNPDCYRLPDYLEDDDARSVWEAAAGTWMGQEVTSGRTLLRTGLFPKFQVSALLEMIEREGVGVDDVPDLVVVNFKTPDYVSHKYGPESAELEAALAALDEEIGRLAGTLGEGSVLAVTADHGMPGEPAVTGGERHYVEDVVASIHERLDPEEKRIVLDFSDPANLQMAIDGERLDELGLELSDVAALLESFSFVRAAFTEDEVRAVRLPR